MILLKIMKIQTKNVFFFKFKFLVYIYYNGVKGINGENRPNDETFKIQTLPLLAL